jgi:glycosyltransferase involved in cell wall biosynthesis
MNSPKCSVIIPTYNGEAYLREAIQSVLDQSYSDFELIVVDDASPCDTAGIIKQFDDRRLKFLVHPTNRGADQARHTGLQASSGEIIAFLDQDDYYHPDKLLEHVGFLDENPDVGFTYNARFELNYSAETIRDLWRPPRNITLQDLVLWFPLSPSDVVLRRRWALEIDLVSGSRGAEIVHFGRLFMAGCRFALVDRALNYRRYHSGRKIKNLQAACESEINNQVKIFTDPRCPDDVITLQDNAHANIYLYWAYLAFAQNETDLGQSYLRNAAQLKPSILYGNPCHLVYHFLINSIDDETRDHELMLQKVFAQIPSELDYLAPQFQRAAEQGYLWRGIRAVMWNRPEDGDAHFEMAAKLKAEINDSVLSGITYQLLSYEKEFGSENTKNILETLMLYFEKVGGQISVRKLKGYLAINRAFELYNSEEYKEVPNNVLTAIANNPRYLLDRGVLSTLVRSHFKEWAK